MWRYWLLCSVAVWGQPIEPYTHSIAASPFLHSFGWGLGVLVQNWSDPQRGSFWMGDFSSYRTKYETRTRSAYRDQGGKDYVFGKLYYAYLLELVYGWQYIVAHRTPTTPLQVSLQLGIGPALALLKPYFIEIAIPISSTQAIIQIDTYKPGQHTYYDIVGEADFYLGFDKVRGVPGGLVQVGALVDMGHSPALVRSLALGLRAQGFFQPIQTLHDKPKRSFWLSGYLAFYIGNAWK
ncbi:MAG: hypothetical protein ABDH91_00570 [Bacteroidia bacterium]